MYKGNPLATQNDDGTLVHADDKGILMKLPESIAGKTDYVCLTCRAHVLIKEEG